jgi:hydroxyacylglutathione hydrolase
MMELITIEVAPIGTNCYILHNGTEGLIVDPGGDADLIISKLVSLDIKVKYILLTHTHFDHIGALDEIKAAFPDALLCVHELEKEALYDPARNLSIGFGINYKYSGQIDLELKDGEEIEFASTVIKVIHTPGHTVGGICYHLDDMLFSGDTLFHSSVGRTDLPGGDSVTLLSSIRNKLFSLPGSTKVYPGHMDSTSIGWEKQRNPYVKI